MSRVTYLNPIYILTKKKAYSTYANILLEDLNEITYGKDDEISDEEFDNFRNIFDTKSASVIKNTIEKMMNKYIENYNISKLSNGYRFNNSDYILKIFEVEEI